MVRPSVDVPIGERIRAYRMRRGMSQEQLSGLVGRSRSWLVKVERGDQTPLNYRVLTEMAHALRVPISDLVGEPLELAPNGGPRFDAIAEIRRVLAGAGETPDEPSDILELAAAVRQARQLRQESRYTALGRAIPWLILRAERARQDAPDQALAGSLLAETYCAAGGLCQQVGEIDLAWTASALAMRAARDAGEPLVTAVTARRVANVLLRVGEHDEALSLATRSAEAVGEGRGADHTSVRGALLLKAAVAAARREDAGSAWQLLARAEQEAEHLGHDGNHLRTAFGPTNVRLHALSLAVELGDPLEAVRRARGVQPSLFPAELHERRSRYHIDLARAHVARGRRFDRLAVDELLHAEQEAREEVRYQHSVRAAVRVLLKRESRTATPELRGFAQRIGVLA